MLPDLLQLLARQHGARWQHQLQLQPGRSMLSAAALKRQQQPQRASPAQCANQRPAQCATCQAAARQAHRQGQQQLVLMPVRSACLLLLGVQVDCQLPQQAELVPAHSVCQQVPGAQQQQQAQQPRALA